jgi:hypothetical protein
MNKEQKKCPSTMAGCQALAAPHPWFWASATDVGEDD